MSSHSWRWRTHFFLPYLSPSNLSDFSGGQGVIKDAERHCLEYVYKNGTGDELLLQSALRSSHGPSEGEQAVLSGDIIYSFEPSAPISNSIFLAYFIYSSSFYDTAMSQRTLSKIFSRTLMCRDRTIFQIFLNTSCGE